MSPMLRGRGTWFLEVDGEGWRRRGRSSPSFSQPPPLGLYSVRGIPPPRFDGPITGPRPIKIVSAPCLRRQGPKGRRGNSWLQRRTSRFRRPPPPTRGGLANAFGRALGLIWPKVICPQEGFPSATKLPPRSLPCLRRTRCGAGISIVIDHPRGSILFSPES